jgi:hypothetical protein
MCVRYLATLGAALVALSAAAIAGPQTRTQVEPAQLPPPFGMPGPIHPGPQSCSPQFQSLLKLQMEGMRRLQGLSRSQGEMLCSALDGADQLGVDKLIDPKLLQRFLTPDQKDLLDSLGIDLSKVDVAKLMRRLGIDPSQVDLRKLTHQCRQGQGEVDRFATSELGRLEREMLRCDDRI